MEEKKSPFFYGWIIVAVCFITVAISYGIRYSFSVFYGEILNEFGWSRADTALIFSLNMIVYGIGAPLSGWAMDRFGPRKFMTAAVVILALGTALSALTTQVWHLYLTFGVLASFGIAATGFATNTAMISRWFYRRRGLAMGIYGAGFGIAYALSSGIEFSVSQIGWRESYIMLGIVAMLLVPLIIVFQRLDPREKGLLPDGGVRSTSPGKTRTVTPEMLIVNKTWASIDWTISRAIRTSRFWWMFLFRLFYWGVASNLIITHQIVYTTDQGYSPAFGALVFTVYGLCYALGSVLAFLSDRFGRELSITGGMLGSAVGVGMLIINQGTETPYLLFIFAVLFGVGGGMGSSAGNAALADIFQGKHFGAITGLSVAGFGIGGAFSPWLGGKIFDEMGTYVPAFYLVIGAIIMAVVCIWVARPRTIRLVPGKVPAALRR